MKDPLNDAEWRKSSHSSGNGGACVEVAFLPDGRIAIRESDDPDAVVITTAVKWNAFLAGVRNNEFDGPSSY